MRLLIGAQPNTIWFCHSSCPVLSPVTLQVALLVRVLAFQLQFLIKRYRVETLSDTWVKSGSAVISDFKNAGLKSAFLL